MTRHDDISRLQLQWQDYSTRGSGSRNRLGAFVSIVLYSLYNEGLGEIVGRKKAR